MQNRLMAQIMHVLAIWNIWQMSIYLLFYFLINLFD